MSMLSNVDIQKELGRNIYIHPLKLENVKGNSLNLTASKLAWSIKSKQSLISQDDRIIIPPNDTALIETNETIYVSDKIGGTYHSKVSLVSKGCGHIGTTLDPLWIGPSLIAIHNHSDKNVELDLEESFVSIIFDYLNCKSTKHNTNKSGRPEILRQFKLSSVEEKWLDEEWRSDPNKLKEKMVNSNEYCNLQKILSKENKFNSFKPFIKYLVLTLLFLIATVIIYNVEEKLNHPEHKVFNWFINSGLSGYIGAIGLSIFMDIEFLVRRRKN